jgi:hypothetical protein
MSDPRLLIDKYLLDQELVENPGLVQTIGDELADAIAVRDTLKEVLATVDAELDSIVREELEQAKKKATESVVAAAIQLHPRHKRAFEEFNEAKLLAAKAASLEKAISSRADNLKVLADLYKSGYFAINATRDTATTREAQYKLMRERLAETRSSKPSTVPRIK